MRSINTDKSGIVDSKSDQGVLNKSTAGLTSGHEVDHLPRCLEQLTGTIPPETIGWAIDLIDREQRLIQGTRRLIAAERQEWDIGTVKDNHR
jgi:hypothetical protein